MKVTKIPIVDFFKGCLNNAYDNEYELLICLLAREADSIDIYEQINKYWTSLNDLTGKRILFVFAGVNESIDMEDLYYLSTRDVKTLNTFRDSVVYKNRFSNELDKLTAKEFNSIKKSHTNSITDLKDYFRLNEKDVPSLIILPIEKQLNKYPVIIKLENYDIYQTIKSIVETIEEPLDEYYEIKNDYNKKCDELKCAEMELVKFCSNNNKIVNRYIKSICYLKNDIVFDKDKTIIQKKEIEFILRFGYTNNIKIFKHETRTYIQRYIDLLKIHPELKDIDYNLLINQLTNLNRIQKELKDETKELYNQLKEKNNYLKIVFENLSNTIIKNLSQNHKVSSEQLQCVLQKLYDENLKKHI